MGRDLGKYTKVQIVLYRIFEIIIFILSTLLLIDFSCNQDCLISTIATGLALFGSVLVVINSRWINFVRLGYIILYIIEAWKFEHYIDSLIKLLVTIPMIIYLITKTFPKREKSAWERFLNVYREQSKKFESPYTVIAFGVFLGILTFILTQIFNGYVEAFKDYTLSGLFFSGLVISGFLFNWYNKNQSIMKWPYGLIYHSLVYYMWSKTSHNYPMDIFCIFWILYTLLGCIEAYYLREFDLEVPSIFEVDLVSMEKRRERKGKDNNGKY